jgi:hypothetical protein
VRRWVSSRWHRVNEHRRVEAESDGDRGKESGNGEIEPVDRDEPPARANEVIEQPCNRAHVCCAAWVWLWHKM